MPGGRYLFIPYLRTKSQQRQTKNRSSEKSHLRKTGRTNIIAINFVWEQLKSRGRKIHSKSQNGQAKIPHKKANTLTIIASNFVREQITRITNRKKLQKAEAKINLVIINKQNFWLKKLSQQKNTNCWNMQKKIRHALQPKLYSNYFLLVFGKSSWWTFYYSFWIQKNRKIFFRRKTNKK